MNYIDTLKQIHEQEQIARRGVEEAKQKIAEYKQQQRQATPAQQNPNATSAPSSSIEESVMQSAMSAPKAEREFRQSVGMSDPNAEVQQQVHNAMQDPTTREEVGQELHNGVSSKGYNRELNDFTADERQAVSDLTLQGATPDEAIEAVGDGKTIEHNPGVGEWAYMQGTNAGLAIMKELGDLAAMPLRFSKPVLQSIGLDKPLEKVGAMNAFDSVKGWLDDVTENLGNAQAQAQMRAGDRFISYDKTKGQGQVIDAKDTFNKFATGTTSMAPLLLEMYAGPIGIGLAAGASESSSLHDYEMTEKEDNDLTDLAASVVKGATTGTLLHYTGKAGERTMNWLTPRLATRFQALCNKFGADSAKRMLANKVAVQLSQEAGGLTSGEAFMIPNAVVNDLTDISKDKIQGTNYYRRNVGQDVWEAAKSGLMFHVGNKLLGIAEHPINSIRTPFRIRGEYKTFKEAQDSYVKALKEYGCTLDGGDNVKLGLYHKNKNLKGELVFIAKDNGDTYDIVDATTYEKRTVPKDEVPVYNSGVKKASTFVSEELGMHLPNAKNFNPPYVTRTADGQLVWSYTDGKKGVAGYVTKADDGKMFYGFDTNGKRRISIYNAETNELLSPKDYAFRKAQNKVEEPDVEDIEAEDVTNAPTDNGEIKSAPQKAETPQVLNEPNEYTEEAVKTALNGFVGDDGNVSTTVDKNGDVWILPTNAVKEGNEMQDVDAFHITFDGDNPTMKYDKFSYIPNEQDFGVETLDNVTSEYLGIEKQPTTKDVTTDGNNTTQDNAPSNNQPGNASDVPADTNKVEQKVEQPKVEQQPKVETTQEETPLINTKTYELDLPQVTDENQVYMAHHNIIGNVVTEDVLKNHIEAIDDQIAEAKSLKMRDVADILARAKKMLKDDIVELKNQEKATKDVRNNLIKQEQSRNAIAQQEANNSLLASQNEQLRLSNANARLNNERIKLEEQRAQLETRAANAVNALNAVIEKSGDMKDVVTKAIEQTRNGNATSTLKAIENGVKAIRSANSAKQKQVEPTPKTETPAETTAVEEAKPVETPKVEETPVAETPVVTETAPIQQPVTKTPGHLSPEEVLDWAINKMKDVTDPIIYKQTISQATKNIRNSSLPNEKKQELYRKAKQFLDSKSMPKYSEIGKDKPKETPKEDKPKKETKAKSKDKKAEDKPKEEVKQEDKKPKLITDNYTDEASKLANDMDRWKVKIETENIDNVARDLEKNDLVTDDTKKKVEKLIKKKREELAKKEEQLAKERAEAEKNKAKEELENAKKIDAEAFANSKIPDKQREWANNEDKEVKGLIKNCKTKADIAAARSVIDKQDIPTQKEMAINWRKLIDEKERKLNEKPKEDPKEQTKKEENPLSKDEKEKIEEILDKSVKRNDGDKVLRESEINKLLSFARKKSKNEEEFDKYVAEYRKKLNSGKKPPKSPSDIINTHNEENYASQLDALKSSKKKYKDQGFDVKDYDAEIERVEKLAKDVKDKEKAEADVAKERADKVSSYEKENKSKVDTRKKPTLENLTTSTPSKSNSTWKKLLGKALGVDVSSKTATTKSGKRVTTKKAVNVDAVMEKFINDFIDNYESATNSIKKGLMGALTDGKGHSKYPHSVEALEELGLISEVKKVKAADKADKKNVTSGAKGDIEIDKATVKHPMTEKTLAHLKNALKGTGLFSNVELLSNEGILKRYEREAGKETAQAIRDANGTLMGFVSKGGAIFLNKEALDADTAVHEVAHSLLKAYESTGLFTEKNWQEATVLAEASGALKELPSFYDNLSMKDRVEEALVRAIGSRGGLKLQGSAWERFKAIANHKWKEILSFFGNETAKASLGFQEIADKYASEIADGKFEERERKAFEKLNENCDDVMSEINKTSEELSKPIADVEEDKTKGIWNRNEFFNRATHNVLKFLNYHGLNRGKESIAEKINRYMFDSLDPVFRLEKELHDRGVKFTGESDYIDAATAGQSIVRAKQEKLTFNQIAKLDDVYQKITDGLVGKKFTNKNGEEVKIETKEQAWDLVDEYLVCMNAKSGRNNREYLEIIDKEFDELFGAKEQQINASAKAALFVTKQADKSIENLGKKVKNLQEKIDNAETPEAKKALEAELAKMLKKEMLARKPILEMARLKANYIKQALKNKAKAEWKEDGEFEPTEEMKDFTSLHLNEGELNKMDLKELKSKFVDVSNYIGAINDYIIKKKSTEKLERAKQEIKEKFEVDRKKMPATEWVHEIWEKEHPGEAPMGYEFRLALEDAKINGFKVGNEKKYVQTYKTDGCGVSNKYAEAYCKRFEDAVGKEVCDDLEEKVKTLTDYTLKESYEGGLVSKKEYDSLQERNDKEHYVPMRGFKYDPKDSESDYAHTMIHDGTGADTNITIGAEGRTSESASAYKSLLNMAYHSVSASQCNKDALNFYKMLSDTKAKRGLQKGSTGKIDDLVFLGTWYVKNGDGAWELCKEIPDVSELSEGPNGSFVGKDGKRYACKGGDVKLFATANDINLSKAKAHSVNIYRDGKKLQMIFAQERVANAMNKTHKRLNNIYDNSVARFLQGFTSMQSKWLTSYSARFALANAERDLGTYLIRMAGSGYKNVGKNISIAYRDMFNYVWRGKEVKMTVNGREYTMDEILNDSGLATGYIETNKQMNADKLRKRVERMRTEQGHALKMENGKYLKEFDLTVKEQLSKDFEITKRAMAEFGKEYTPENLQKVCENIGDMVAKGKIKVENLAKIAEFLELAPRYMAFRTALDNGASFKEAVHFGKNITTNFNRAGDLKYSRYGQLLYAGVPFFNAAMQGIKMAKDMTQTETPRVVKAMIGMAFVGFIMNEVERKIYGQTSFGKDKITTLDDYNRGSTVRIPLGENDFVPVYMPHFFRMPLDLTMNLSDYLHGDRTTSEALMSCIGSFADVTHWDFSKLKDGWNGLLDISISTVMPGFGFKPLCDIGRNRNFFGGNIYAEPFDENDTTPAWQNTIGHNTWPVLVSTCKKLNEIGGGDDEVAAGRRMYDNGIVKTDDGLNFNNALFNWNPAKIQYFLVQSFPSLQYAEYAYRAYSKADEDDDITVKEAVSLVPKAMQLNKVFDREFQDENITAGQMAYKAKANIKGVQTDRKDSNIEKTQAQKEYWAKWMRVNMYANAVKKLKKAQMKAAAAGNKALASKYEELKELKQADLARQLNDLAHNEQLWSGQRAVVDRWNKIESMIGLGNK